MSNFFLLALIFFTASVVFVPIAIRLGLGSVLGYLTAGIAVGPVLNALEIDVVALQHFAEFGVVLMLFLVGLELAPKRIWAMRARLFGLGGAQVVLTSSLLAGAAYLLGLSWQVSLAVGLILSLSSTAIVLQTLSEKGLMRSDGGESAFSVLLFQDIAVIPMLALLPLLAVPELLDIVHANADGESHDSTISVVAGLPGWQAMLVTLGAIGGVIVGGSYLAGPLFRYISAIHLRELFTITALFIVVGIAMLMTLVGLSPALGTFLAGVVLATSEYRHELESDIEPFRGLLLGLFFIAVGAGIDFNLLSENLALTVGLALGLMVAKGLVLYILGCLFKVGGEQRWLFALSLAQGGEFAFVLLAFTVGNGVLPQDVADQLLLCVTLSMLLTPLLFIVYERFIAPRYARCHERPSDTVEERHPIILAGRGRVGGLVEHMLNAAGYQATVIDFSSRHLDILRRFGLHAYFGDATRPDLLQAAGIAEAKLLIVTIDGKDQITRLVDYVIRNYPHVHVIARAVDREHVYQLWSLGCKDIIRETYDSSLRIGRSAYEALGASRDLAERMKDEFDIDNRKAMVEMADAYDSSIPNHENEVFITKAKELLEAGGQRLRQRMHEIMESER